MNPVRRLVRYSIIILLIGIFTFVCFISQGSHHTNLKYIGWKKKIVLFDHAPALEFLNVDVSFRQSLEGKTKKEILEWFPDLHSLNESNEYQEYYLPYIDEEEFYWIGDSAWGIVFKDGRLEDFRLLKG